jgi:hypothetical protein
VVFATASRGSERLRAALRTPAWDEKGTTGARALKTYPVELRDGAIWLTA